MNPLLGATFKVNSERHTGTRPSVYTRVLHCGGRISTSRCGRCGLVKQFSASCQREN
jgi:hypothetical protein